MSVHRAYQGTHVLTEDLPGSEDSDRDSREHEGILRHGLTADGFSESEEDARGGVHWFILVASVRRSANSPPVCPNEQMLALLSNGFNRQSFDFYRLHLMQLENKSKNHITVS